MYVQFDICFLATFPSSVMELPGPWAASLTLRSQQPDIQTLYSLLGLTSTVKIKRSLLAFTASSQDSKVVDVSSFLTNKFTVDNYCIVKSEIVDLHQSLVPL